MSKERLEEVDSWLLSMKETLFQAVKEGEKEEEIEEVQHLIDVFEWLREQAFAVHGGETFIGYKEQMNRYREVIKKAIDDLENECLWDALVALKELEDE